MVEKEGRSHVKLVCIVWRLEFNVWLNTDKKFLENKLTDLIGLEEVSYSILLMRDGLVFD